MERCTCTSAWLVCICTANGGDSGTATWFAPALPSPRCFGRGRNAGDRGMPQSPITCNPREGAVQANDRPQEECKGPGCPSPMSAGSADPGAQCSDAQNMALLIEDVNCMRIPQFPVHVRTGPLESRTPGDTALPLERRFVVELVVVFGIAAGSGFRGAPVVVG